MTDAAPIDAFRHHGGRIDRARALFPDAGDWIDLSTGISPVAYSATIDPATLTALPDPAALADLESAARAAFGAHAGFDVVAVPGSDLALRLIGRLFEGRTAAVVRPGYGGHVAIWPQVKAVTADTIEQAAARDDVLLLANPNNPDGGAIGRNRLLSAAAALAQRSGWLVVDEAFADATPETSLAEIAGDNIILLRSFGKFYGLPGLRLGFVLAPAGVAAKIRDWLGDWPISGPAIAIATGAYRDYRWQAAQRRLLVSGAARLDALVRKAGLAVRGGTVLFRLVEAGDAEALFRHLAGHAILTRPFVDDPDVLRMGLPGDEEQWARLERALGEWES
ncbi:MAG: threonine-phosphate decarboxylase [Rhizorhabdus sp.]|nr:threonine-phosphate decarboxylase [Rhizorhabdus sp.]